MLRGCVLDFSGTWERHLPLVEFAYNNSFQSSIGMAPFEALYGRPSQSRQKSYADRRRRPLAFEVGDHVFLKISPRRGLMRFGKSGKLSPRFIGPFEILEKIGEVAYRLALPPQLSGVHDVFHVSMLRKYEPDPSHVLDWTDLEVDEDASYEERPVRVLDRRDQVLRGKTIPLVKVLWKHHGVEEATWERELELVRETTEKVELIRRRLVTAQSRQKSYADRRRRPLAFEVGDHVFLKISPRRGLMRFGKSGKLSPRFIGPFEILEKIGEVAYRLALPPQLSGVHDVFHVSMLRKYEPDPSHVLDWTDLEVDEDASYEERPVRVLDRRDQVLRGKTIPLVKVLWKHHGVEEATWERELEMCWAGLLQVGCVWEPSVAAQIFGPSLERGVCRSSEIIVHGWFSVFLLGCGSPYMGISFSGAGSMPPPRT
ncbi:hypothetical protein CsSME_00026758 [Camellia sinensis var. sinensis]